MATALGAGLGVEIIFDLVDYAGETGRVVIPVDGTISDGDIVSIVDDFIALTNCLVTPTVKRTYGMTGYDVSARPKSANQGLIAAVAALEFQKTNPVNALKTVEKQVPLPSYIDAIRNDSVKPHVPVTGNSTLNALNVLLEANLDMVGSDGSHYPGSWTFNPASKFGTKLTVTDGQ